MPEEEKEREQEFTRALIADIKESLETLPNREEFKKVISELEPVWQLHTAEVIFIATSLMRVIENIEEYKSDVIQAAYLHDLGKIAVSKEVRTTTDRYTPIQRMEMDSHVGKGVELIQKIARESEKGKFIARIVSGHHAFQGRPVGEADEDAIVGFFQLLLAIADQISATRGKRPDRTTPLSTEEALKEIQNNLPVIQEEGTNYKEIVVTALELHNRLWNSEVAHALEPILFVPNESVKEESAKNF